MNDRLPPSNGDACSDAAAESMRPHTHRLRREVWLHLRSLGPSTCDEVEARSGLAHQTCSARFNELAAVGCIARTGDRRPTRSGRRAWVYEATPIEPL